jgi:hypothetical protein
MQSGRGNFLKSGHLKDQRMRWEDNIKMDINKICCDFGWWMEMARNPVNVYLSQDISELR